VTTTLTLTLTIAQEMAVRYLCQRGFKNAEIEEALGNVSKWHVIDAAAEYRKDGSVTLYRDECIARAIADPHRHDAAAYLSARGIPHPEIATALQMGKNHLKFDPEAKRRYQARQVEIVRAAVSEGREL